MAVLVLLLVWLWWRARSRQPFLYAGFALAATVALSPLFHPWYWTWPLAVLAATARRTGWFSLVALASSFLVLADGTGLPRWTKMPGAPLMTLLVIVVTVRLVRSARVARKPVPADAVAD
jgi:alpha-1,6-mannosyltransferase